MRPCTGKTALVTNTSGPIGRAVAIALGKAGAQVLMHHTHSSSAAEQAVEKLRAAGGTAATVSVDLASAGGARELALQTRTIIGDRLDILVFNARLSKFGNPDDALSAAFDNEFAANVRAPLFLVHELLPIMSRGSSLVFSLAPPEMPEDGPASSAIRGGLNALVSRLTSLTMSRGIRVDAIVPVSASSASVAHVGSTSARLAPQHRRSGSGPHRPMDVARAVTALVTSPG